MDRMWFVILTTEQRDTCIGQYSISKDIKSCDICDEDVFADSCEGCPYKNKSVHSILIESYIPLAKHLAGTFSGYPSDELLEVALLAAVQAVSSIPTLDYLYDVDAYIGKYIIFELMTHIKRLSIVHIPKDVKSNGDTTVTYLGNYDTAVYGDFGMCDLQEFIRSIPTTPDQEIVLRLTLEGYTDEEIEPHLNVSRRRVTQIKTAMLDKLRKELCNVEEGIPSIGPQV